MNTPAIVRLAQLLDIHPGHDPSTSLPIPAAETPAAGAPKEPPAQVQEAPATHSTENADPASAHDDEDDWYWCMANRRRGGRCIAFRVKGSTFCAGHEPSLREKLRSGSSQGGRVTAARRRIERRARDFSFDTLVLADRESVQQAIDAVFRLELTGQLPAARSQHLLRALSIAARNLSGRNAPELERRTPGARISSLDRDLARALQTADSRDAARRATRTLEESHRRAQLAVDLENFPILDRRSASRSHLRLIDDDAVLDYGA